MVEVIGCGQTIEEAKDNALKKLEAPSDVTVKWEIISMPTKKILGIFGGSSAKVKASYDEIAHERNKTKLKEEKQRKEKEAAQFIDKVKAPIVYIQNGEYQKAENLCYELLYDYDENQREIDRLGYLRSLAWLDKDEEEQDKYTKMISEKESKIKDLRPYLDDLRFAYSLTMFKRRSTISVESIIKVLAAAYRGEIQDKTLKAYAKEITDKYAEEYLYKAKECYAAALDYMDDGDMAKAKKYMALPGMLNYKDAEQLYAVLRVVADNDPDSYEDIMKTLVNGKDKIESSSFRQVAEDTIKELGRALKAKREQSPGKSLPKNKYTTVLATKAANALSDDEVAFMDWTIEKNRAAKKYEDKIKKEEECINPIGDSDFPVDVDSFPTSEKIW